MPLKIAVSEEKFLRTIELEEKYGGKTCQQQKAKEDKRKASEKGKAAIAFVYEDSTPTAAPVSLNNKEEVSVRF